MKLNPNKAPDPDRLTSAFFKEVWPIVGVEFLDAIRKFFITWFLPLSTNATILALVPKTPGASAVSDYMPVFYCNTVYKVISKLFMLKVKPLRPDF